MVRRSKIVHGPQSSLPCSYTAQEMVHPNILHLLSQTQSSRSCPRPSSLSYSLPLTLSSAIRWILLFTPYSLIQHWNGFILGASSLVEDVELPSTRLRAGTLRAFRSSRSPHKRKSFSRSVSRAAGALRRLRIRIGLQSLHQKVVVRRLTPLLRVSIDPLHPGRLHRLQ